MLQGRLINREATLNTFWPVANYPYSPGDYLTLKFQVLAANPPVEGDVFRYVLPATATLAAYYLNATGVETATASAPVVVDALDRSLWSLAFTVAEVNAFSSMNLKIVVNLLGDGTQLYSFILKRALAKNLMTASC